MILDGTNLTADIRQGSYDGPKIIQISVPKINGPVDRINVHYINPHNLTITQTPPAAAPPQPQPRP